MASKQYFTASLKLLITFWHLFTVALKLILRANALLTGILQTLFWRRKTLCTSLLLLECKPADRTRAPRHTSVLVSLFLCWIPTWEWKRKKKLAYFSCCQLVKWHFSTCLVICDRSSGDHVAPSASGWRRLLIGWLMRWWCRTSCTVSGWKVWDAEVGESNSLSWTPFSSEGQSAAPCLPIGCRTTGPSCSR